MAGRVFIITGRQRLSRLSRADFTFSISPRDANHDATHGFTQLEIATGTVYVRIVAGHARGRDRHIGVHGRDHVKETGKGPFEDAKGEVGGARYSTFDYAVFDRNRPEPHQPPVDEAQMWARMERFLAAVPAAEKAGVRLALHPDDPPIPEPLAGVAQICSTLEQFRRIFFETAPSESNCMLFCQGCMTELLGPERVYDAIAEMASKDKDRLGALPQRARPVAAGSPRSSSTRGRWTCGGRWRSTGTTGSMGRT